MTTYGNKVCRYCGARFYPDHANRFADLACGKDACKRARKTELQRERRAIVRQADRLASSGKP